MSLESLKTFLNSNPTETTSDFGKVDPYNTFTFKFTGGRYNTGINGDIHKYIKQVTLPNASINGEQINIPGIQFATHRLMPMGDSGSTIRVEFLNTTKPILEEKLFSWMRAYTIEANKFPFDLKSNIEIGFTHSKQNNGSDKIGFESKIDKYKYMYYGVRPVEMTTYKPSNEPMTEFYRSVTFAYDYFWIQDQYDQYVGEADEQIAEKEKGYAQAMGH